ncbi:Maf family protein [Flavihumibacter rivuli]|uniref:Maf family protein n=1 Tax=Flavihumibacter rivuli TaxID=2838156 RepID=UPI001BDE95E5|nr:Maf family protein [Flavihumibacter rivuli]ULQ57569.1 Maf family protein [Flavihumibacter rivuli]
MERIVLASQSPRRKQLLEWAEVPFDIIVQPTDESFPPYMAIEEVPVHIARQKAMLVQEMFSQERLVLAADTIVVLDNQVIGKPTDREDAINILSRLSGRTHRVITGVVMRKNGIEKAFADITEVSFHSLTHDQLVYYVDHYQPYDKAGAYAIQEWIGVVGIQSIRGDFYNVMGLPVSKVVMALQDWP